MVQRRGATAGLLLLILALALGLRFYRLDAHSLWNDEGTSVAVARLDPVSIAHNAALDIHPPLYYWLLSGWVRLVGTSEGAVRSFSALLGVLLVAVTFALGRKLCARGVALLAALLSAIHPFQIYYSQEARMYILLALVTAASALALAVFVTRESRLALGLLVLSEAAGLYTHYSFLFVVLVLNLAFVMQLRRKQPARPLLLWIGSQAAVVLLYLPWLPTAVRQIRAWPSPAQPPGFLAALADTWRWIVLGPTIETGQVIPALIVAAMVVVAGIVSLGLGVRRRTPHMPRWSTGLFVLWLGLPVLLLFVLGLFREAYLKFLLITTPPLCLLLAGGLLAPPPSRAEDEDSEGDSTRRRFQVGRYLWRVLQVVATAILLVAILATLSNYYYAPSYARDDYRGIAAYIDAAGRPGDAILLNAPGQQDVFDYYYEGELPVYPLPASRPLDPGQTESALENLAEPGARVFAVLWATDESDPERLVEGWLDQHAYKAQDSWYGNVRLAAYAVPDHAPSAPSGSTVAMQVPLRAADSGDEVTLVGYELSDDRFEAGDIAQLTLFWRAERTPSNRYKVFVHVLDEESHIVGQRDAEPGGGAYLTTLWAADEMVVDNYGVPLHPATPPGVYAVEVGMYDLETGLRLADPDGATQVWLGQLGIDRPAAPPPLEILGMQSAIGADLGAIELLGHSAYKLGFSHQSEAPLRAGDVLHVEIFWKANDRPSGDWQVAITLVASDGRQVATVVAEPVGGYSTSLWEPGDVWRGQFNLLVPIDASPGEHRLEVQPLPPDGSLPAAFDLTSLRLEP